MRVVRGVSVTEMISISSKISATEVQKTRPQRGAR